MKNIPYSVIVILLGVIGLVMTFVEDEGKIASKIPLTIFFLFIIILGILYEMYKGKDMDVYGEFENNRGVG